MHDEKTTEHNNHPHATNASLIVCKIDKKINLKHKLSCKYIYLT